MGYNADTGHCTTPDMIVTALLNLEAGDHAKAAVTGVHGFGPPDCCFRSPLRKPEEHESGSKRHGWQQEASVPCEWDFTERQVTAQTKKNDCSCVFCADFMIS